MPILHDIYKLLRKEIMIIDHPKFFPYQSEGVKFIESRNGRALIADECGLGKTLQSLWWLHNRPDAFPALIVVPASLKLNWRNEINKWLKRPCHILNGKKPNKTILTNAHNVGIVIINYDIINTWKKLLLKLNWNTIILDESHKCKNEKALRTKATLKITKKCKHVLCLTGTPILSKPIELFTTLKMLDDSMYPSWWNFAHRYCGLKQTKYGLDVKGATNTKELHDNLVKTVMIRRLKKNVLKDLPPKLHSTIPFKINNNGEYKAAEQGFMDWIRGDNANMHMEGLAKIEYMKQAACKGKIADVLKWLADFLENDRKLVVMGIHRVVLDKIMGQFGKVSVRLSGETASKERQQVVDEFQNNDRIRMFVGNIQAAGVGITLTAASDVAFVELPWTPSDYVQAADRCHRLGQKDSVNIYNLLAEDTIEMEIARMLKKKSKIVDSVLDGKGAIKTSMLKDLIKLYKEER